MLVLKRKRDESIMIGDSIEITVVEVRGDTVKIGVSAPVSITVYRKEIYEAIQRENIAASKSSPRDLSQLAEALLKGKKKQAEKPHPD